MLDVVANIKGIIITIVALKSSTDSTTISNGNVESLLVNNTQLIAHVRSDYYYYYYYYYYWLNSKWNKRVSTMI